jgi:hypothetical protein
MGFGITFFKPLSSNVFIASCFLFVGSQLFQWTTNEPSFVHSYLDDLVVMPILLTITCVFLRIVFKQENLQLELPMIVSAFILLSIVFEFVLPRYSSNFYADKWDVVCYGIGTVVYILGERKAIKAI